MRLSIIWEGEQTGARCGEIFVSGFFLCACGDGGGDKGVK